MPKFFLDVFDDIVATDETGVELPSSAAAIEAAHRGARNLAAAQVLDGALNLSHRIVVRDEQGIIAEIPFRHAVAVTG